MNKLSICDLTEKQIELYQKDPIFNSCISILSKDFSIRRVLSCLEVLSDRNEELSKTLEDFIKNDTRKMEVVISDEINTI